MNVVHVGVGPISQSDLDLAKACGACIVGFNVKSPPSSITLEATQASIKVPRFDCCQLQLSLSVGVNNSFSINHIYLIICVCHFGWLDISAPCDLSPFGGCWKFDSREGPRNF